MQCISPEGKVAYDGSPVFSVMILGQKFISDCSNELGWVNAETRQPLSAFLEGTNRIVREITVADVSVEEGH